MDWGDGCGGDFEVRLTTGVKSSERGLRLTMRGFMKNGTCEGAFFMLSCVVDSEKVDLSKYGGLMMTASWPTRNAQSSFLTAVPSVIT